MLGGMATPAATERDRRSPAKHAAILKAATEVFLREGYARASVDAIAEAAGVGKQTVYGHFGDKQRLFLAVVEEANNANGGAPDELASLITDTGNPRADLEAAAARLVRGITAPDVAALHRLTIAEMTHHPELQRSWRDSGRTQDVIAVIARYLAECDRRGELTVPDPETSARQFVMLLSAEAQVRSLRGLEPLSKDDVSGIARDTADLIVRAHQPQLG
jgi:TetR/AcrR family transcriptional regulator, mexJK operon transcriptional repressor